MGPPEGILAATAFWECSSKLSADEFQDCELDEWSADLRSIPLPMRDDTPHATPRIRHVTLAPWDEMPVGMHHRLPRRLTTVQADVETADGGIGHQQILPPPLQECSDGIPLGLMKLHPIGHMPAGDHQAVAFGDGIGIGRLMYAARRS